MMIMTQYQNFWQNINKKEKTYSVFLFNDEEGKEDGPIYYINKNDYK